MNVSKTYTKCIWNSEGVKWCKAAKTKQYILYNRFYFV